MAQAETVAEIFTVGEPSAMPAPVIKVEALHKYYEMGSKQGPCAARRFTRNPPW